jgi:hypothetical protein
MSNRFFKVRFDGEEITAWFVDQLGCGFEFLKENGDAYEVYSSREKEIIKQLEEDIEQCIREGWVTKCNDINLDFFQEV